VAGGVIWIVLVAALLAGIVAVNVAALRLSLESQRLEERRQNLLADNAALTSDLSSLGAASRVESTARGRLGLVDAAAATYVKAKARNPGR
jgi:cell division protein FtsL